MLYIRSGEHGDDFVLEREPREHMMLPGLSRLAILIMIALLITPLLMPSMSFILLWVLSLTLLSIAQVPFKEVSYWRALKIKRDGRVALECINTRGEFIRRQFRIEELVAFSLMTHRPLPATGSHPGSRYADLSLELIFRDESRVAGELMIRDVLHNGQLRELAEHLAVVTGLFALRATADHNGHLFITGQAPADQERDTAHETAYWLSEEYERRPWHPSLEYFSDEVSVYQPGLKLHFIQKQSSSVENLIALSIFLFCVASMGMFFSNAEPVLVPICTTALIILTIVIIGLSLYLRTHREVHVHKLCFLKKRLDVEALLEAELERTELEGTHLEGTYLEGTYLEGTDLSDLEYIKLTFAYVNRGSKRRSLRRQAVYEATGEIYACLTSGERIKLASTGQALADEMLYQSAVKLANVVADGLQAPLKVFDLLMPEELRGALQQALQNEEAPIVTDPPRDEEWSIIKNPHLSQAEPSLSYKLLHLGLGEVPPARAYYIRAMFFLVLLVETLCL